MRRTIFLLAAAALAIALLVPVALARDAARSSDGDRGRHGGRLAVVVSADPAGRTVTLRVPQVVAASLQAGDYVLLRGRPLLRARADDRPFGGDDEVEVVGTLTSLGPVVVRTPSGGVVRCAVPSGVSLAGLGLGDTVEITCDLLRGTWVLRTIHSEDGDGDRRRGRDDDDDRGGNSGPGGGGGDGGSGSGRSGGSGDDD